MNLNEIRTQLNKIETSIQIKGKEIRRLLIETNKLKEKNYPNLNVLIHGLSRLEQTSIGLSVALNSSINFPSSNNKLLQQQQTKNSLYFNSLENAFKQTKFVSTPNSIHDSKSLNTSSSSASTSPNNSLTQNSPIRSSGTLIPNESAVRYFELNSNTSILTPANSSLLTANSSYSFSPTSTSSISHNNSNRSLQILEANGSSCLHQNELLNKLDEAFRWIRSKQVIRFYKTLKYSHFIISIIIY
jgi:hypothetical protein